jgi:SAM-dependent methyltransferase
MQIGYKSKCRFCANDLDFSVIDLGMSPLCEKFISTNHLNEMEKFYPLHAFVCKNCWLMQLEEFETPDEIFAVDYSYYSSYSATWVDHARKYTRQMINQFDINSKSLVVEIASNDGYLLQWFVKEGIPVLGIDPAANIAKAAVEKGVRTEVKFFGREIALELVKNYGKADLLIGNNVLAHVPDINDFVGGMKEMLGTGGVITMEFPHLQRLIEGNQFDTIYHEHYSYLSFSVVNRIFAYHGLTLFDVEELSTHGGSLRIFGKHSDDKNKIITGRVHELLQREKELGFESVDFYLEFEEKVKETKRKLLMFLIDIKRQNKSVVGYGAPGKGNTLLNYCGIRTDFLDYTVDISPHKQGNFLPGTHIPILHPDQLKKTRPDYILILPWNLKDEIIKQLEYVREWGGKFVIPIPELTVIM